MSRQIQYPTGRPTGSGAEELSRFLVWMTASRLASGVVFMTWAASLPYVIAGWGLSAAQAGLVQTAFNLTYAVALLGSAWFADRWGARRIFALSNALSLAAFTLCALFARSLPTALILFSLLAASLGGTYAPSLMMAAQATTAERRGVAVGWTLAGSSVGYFVVIAVCAAVIPHLGLQWTWMLLILAPVVSTGAALLASRAVPTAANSTPADASAKGASCPSSTEEPGLMQTLRTRSSLLLTAGYAAHCWELLGMWAWAPAFVMVTLAHHGAGPLVAGLLTAAALHLSGAASTLIGGAASDRFGRRRVLVAVALVGAGCSFAFGWLGPLGAIVTVTAAALYGFAALGDSGVLSAAMADATPPALLGRMLALRSITGFGAGALAPVAFGLTLDLMGGQGGNGWGWAFALLGLGGLGAAACAALLPREP